jgi:hypothetical protein
MKYDLTISRVELLNGLAMVKKGIGRTRRVDLLFYKENEFLVVSAQGMEHMIDATGTWPGTVRISSQFLGLILKVPPRGDPLNLHVKEGRLHLGNLSFTCSID